MEYEYQDDDDHDSFWSDPEIWEMLEEEREEAVESSDADQDELREEVEYEADFGEEKAEDYTAIRRFVRDSWSRIREASGHSSPFISELRAETGLSKEELHEALRQYSREGHVVLSIGDRSITPQEAIDDAMALGTIIGDAGIDKPYHRVRFVDPIEDDADVEIASAENPER